MNNVIQLYKDRLDVCGSIIQLPKCERITAGYYDPEGIKNIGIQIVLNRLVHEGLSTRTGRIGKMSHEAAARRLELEKQLDLSRYSKYVRTEYSIRATNELGNTVERILQAVPTEHKTHVGITFGILKMTYRVIIPPVAGIEILLTDDMVIRM